VLVALTTGVGLTSTDTIVILVQLPADAAMVNIVVCGVVVLFVKIPEIEGPVPLTGIPVRLVVLVLDQLNVAPATLFGFEISIWLMAAPEQIV
jgi:hypothetical protein